MAYKYKLSEMSKTASPEAAEKELTAAIDSGDAKAQVEAQKRISTLAFENANTTGASGDMWVTGLPFAHSGPYTVQSCSMNSAGTYPNSSPLALVSGTICYFYKHTSNGVPTAVYHNAGTSRAIRVTGSYRVA